MASVPSGYVTGTAICLSSLLEAGRYGELIELLACARIRSWHWHRFGAEALAQQGACDAALSYADGCRTPQGYADRQIDRFCEGILIKSGRAHDAYYLYGLKAATGRPIFRQTTKRYPDRDRRQVLLDLIETRGERGKWFAAAKDAGSLDVALQCARDYAAEPATLVRTARDFVAKQPKFAVKLGVIALTRLLNGGGYDPEIALVQEAFGHLRDAARRIDASDWAKHQVQVLVDGPCHPNRQHFQSALAECVGRCDDEPVGD